MAGLNMDKLKERLEQLNSGGGSGAAVGFINLKSGRNQVRILPPGGGSDEFYQEVWVHYGVGKNDTNTKGTMVVCPTTRNEKASCPVCELAKELRSLSKVKDDEYSKQARSIGRKKRVYFNALDRAEDPSTFTKGDDGWKDPEGKSGSPVRVLGVGVGIFKDILKLICDPEYGDITDTEEGLDLIIEKSGSGQFNTEYDVRAMRKESVVGFDAWEENLNDLKQFAKIPTYDELAAMMDGESEDKADADDEDEDEDDTSHNTPVDETSEAETSTGEPAPDSNDIRAAIEARRRARANKGH